MGHHFSVRIFSSRRPFTSGTCRQQPSRKSSGAATCNRALYGGLESFEESSCSVWCGEHFIGDFRKTSEDYQVFFNLASRLYFCLALSYVFGWLTLRSGSIWPAVLAHGLHNVWVLSTAYWLRVQDSWLVKVMPWVCWGLLAVVLFRFWPPTAAKDDSVGVSEIRAEPAD